MAKSFLDKHSKQIWVHKYFAKHPHSTLTEASARFYDEHDEHISLQEIALIRIESHGMEPSRYYLEDYSSLFEDVSSPAGVQAEFMANHDPTKKLLDLFPDIPEK